MEQGADLVYKVTTDLCRVADRYTQEYMEEMTPPVLLSSISEFTVTVFGELKKITTPEQYALLKEIFLNSVTRDI
jgi:hypothetical protein